MHIKPGKSKMKRDIFEHNSIKVPEEAFVKFLEILDKPPQPNQKLIDMMQGQGRKDSKIFIR